MKVYPEAGYQSWISEIEADDYFETRLNSAEWNTADREAALITAFQDLNLLLDLDINLLLDDAPLPLLKKAQAEQALYLLKNDLDARSLESANIGSSVYVKLGAREPRIAYNVVEMLSHYVILKTASRYR